MIISEGNNVMYPDTCPVNAATKTCIDEIMKETRKEY